MEFIVSASELFQRAKELLNDGMDYVSVTLEPANDDDPDDPLPACVILEGISKRMPGARVAYDEIECVTDSID